MKTSSRTVVAAALAVLAWGGVHATEIYRWTDENGVVHFSQTAPPPEQADASRVALQDTRPSDFDPEADIFNVAEQEQRMQALREEREQKRQQRLEREQAAARLQPVPQPVYYERSYPVWWPGHHPQPPLRPTPPIARPPSGPGAPIRPPRPITPRQ